jgi:hypothetical protein
MFRHILPSQLFLQKVVRYHILVREPDTYTNDDSRKLSFNPQSLTLNNYSNWCVLCEILHFHTCMEDKVHGWHAGKKSQHLI